jgi:hypothetical protein
MVMADAILYTELDLMDAGQDSRNLLGQRNHIKDPDAGHLTVHEKGAYAGQRESVTPIR